MSSSTLAYDDARPHRLSRVADFVELTKPKIGILVLATVAVAAFVAQGGPPNAWALGNTLLGIALVAASASALNQWLERGTDALMPRTADRPLPQQRLTTGQVGLFATITVIAGVGQLALAVNLTTAAVGLMTWIIYVWIYTPLKRRTSANTMVGAIAGALPVLMGWSCLGLPFDFGAATLFLVVFLWQFPHFMAIAWIYREDYRKADMKMLTVVDPTGRRAGAQAILAALVLIPISLIPALQLLEPIYFAGAALLGLVQLAYSVMFFFQLDQVAARRLLRVTLIYLPALLLLLLLTPVI